MDENFQVFLNTNEKCIIIMVIHFHSSYKRDQSLTVRKGVTDPFIIRCFRWNLRNYITAITG